MKISKKWLAMTTLVTLAPMLAGVALWNALPDTMATHWGMNGEANGFSSKPFAVFGLPLLVTAIHLLCVVAEAKGMVRVRAGMQLVNYAKSTQPIAPVMGKILLLTCPMISLICGGVTYGYALGVQVDVGQVVLLFAGVLFLLVGNYLPKTRRNATVGIKLPWTLKSDDNWNRTHRFAGPLWMLCGALMLVAAVAGWARLLVLPAILAMTLLPLGYSYRLNRKSREKEGA